MGVCSAHEDPHARDSCWSIGGPNVCCLYVSHNNSMFTNMQSLYQRANS